MKLFLPCFCKAVARVPLPSPKPDDLKSRQQYKFVHYKTLPLNPKTQPPYIPNTKFTGTLATLFL